MKRNFNIRVVVIIITTIKMLSNAQRYYKLKFQKWETLRYTLLKF